VHSQPLAAVNLPARHGPVCECSGYAVSNALCRSVRHAPTSSHYQDCALPGWQCLAV